jgi:beta-lactamase regulating signal transducer with metallopeptidase domain
MERLFVECAVRATLLVGAAAIVLYAMRVKAATARHSVWAGVVAMMLLLPVWTTWGPKASFRMLPPLVQSVANSPKAPIGILSTGVLRATLIDPKLVVLLGAYLLGLGLLLFRLAIGTVRAHRLVRNAVLQDGVRTSSSCAAPVTVGFFHPTVIFPEYWRQWPQTQLDAVLTHESEHARRRHPLIQWLALLNRAVFWFHPIAWWLERHLSVLAEEACDNVVLLRGCDRRAYSEYLIDMARSVTRSGVRLNIAGMAMPGSSLPRRIRQIVQGRSVPHISRTRMACVCVACSISCTAIAAGTLDHAKLNSSAEHTVIPRESASAAHPATKFVLGDLKIQGDVHDRDGVRDRILKAWKSREYDDGRELTDEAAAAIRGDFQERGYFQVAVQAPASQPLGLTAGKQSILIIASITEGDQFRLRTITIQSAAPDRPLSISAATLREQFRLRDGDLFNMTEIRAGLERLQRLYVNHGYAGVSAEPDTEITSTLHRIDLVLRISEGQHTP